MGYGKRPASKMGEKEGTSEAFNFEVMLSRIRKGFLRNKSEI